MLLIVLHLLGLTAQAADTNELSEHDKAMKTNTMNQLRAMIESKIKQIETINEETAGVMAKVAPLKEMQKRLAESQKQLELDKAKTNQTLKREDEFVAEADKEKEGADNLLQDSQKRKDAANTKLEKLKQRQAKIQSEMKKATAEHDDSMTKLTGKAGELAVRVQSVENANKDLEHKKTIFEHKTMETEKERESLKIAEKMTKRVKELAAEDIAKEEQDMAKATEDATAINAETSKLAEEANELQKRNDAAQAALQSNTDAKEEEEEKENADNGKSAAQINEAKNEEAEMQPQIEMINQDSATMMQQVKRAYSIAEKGAKDIEQHMKDTKGLIEANTEKIANLKKKNKAKSQELQDLNARMESNTSDMQQFDQNMAKLQHKQASKESQLATAKKTLSALENQIAQMQNNNTAKLERKLHAEQDMAALKAQADKEQQELLQKQKELDAKEQEILDATQKIQEQLRVKTEAPTQPPTAPAKQTQAPEEKLLADKNKLMEQIDAIPKKLKYFQNQVFALKKSGDHVETVEHPSANPMEFAKAIDPDRHILDSDLWTSYITVDSSQELTDESGYMLAEDIGARLGARVIAYTLTASQTTRRNLSNDAKTQLRFAVATGSEVSMKTAKDNANKAVEDAGTEAKHRLTLRNLKSFTPGNCGADPKNTIYSLNEDCGKKTVVRAHYVIDDPSK